MRKCLQLAAVFLARLGVVFILVGLVAAAPPVNPLGGFKMDWDPSANPNVDYILYAGTNSTVYNIATNVGPVLSFTITNLVRGQTYYFGVAARYNTNAPAGAAGLESPISNEISYTPPQPPAAPPNLRIP